MTAAVQAPAGPAHLWVPPGRRGTYLDEVGEVAETLGRPLDPWGVTAVDALMSFGPGGRWWTLESVLKMPRQVGKTKGICLPIALTVSTVFDPLPRLWTAHREKTYLETFDLAKQLIDGSAEFSRRVSRIREADGDKGIEFTNGAVLDFGVRSGQLGRGQEYPEHFVDEALVFKPSWASALLPTMAAQDNPRVLYASSAAVEGEDSDHLRELTSRGRSGADRTLTLVEWCAPGSWDEPGCVAGRECDHRFGAKGCALDDELLWRAAIPSIGVRTSIEFIATMRRSFGQIPSLFGQEFLGWDARPARLAAMPIPLGLWDRCADPAGRIVGDPMLFLTVAPDRRASAVVLAGWREDGLVQVEVVRHAAGESWVLDDLRRAYAAGMRTIGVDEKGPAAVLIPDLEAIGFTVVRHGARDVVLSCAGLQRDVGEGRLRHLGDARLRDAIEGAAKRPLGDTGGWAWSWSLSSGDITPLVAMTGARQVLVTATTAAGAVPLVEWGD